MRGAIIANVMFARYTSTTTSAAAAAERDGFSNRRHTTEVSSQSCWAAAYPSKMAEVIFFNHPAVKVSFPLLVFWVKFVNQHPKLSAASRGLNSQ
jgi:hypothetical protein